MAKFACIEFDEFEGQDNVITYSSERTNSGWTVIKGSTALCCEVLLCLERHGYKIAGSSEACQRIMEAERQRSMSQLAADIH